MASHVNQARSSSQPLDFRDVTALDPDDPRPPYVQVAGALRAAILTKTLQPGDKLPSGSQLSQRYGVARMTVQQAIRLLRDEGLVVSRQGSGVFVRERTARPVGLRPVMERAFQRPQVTVDFFGFTAETLLGAVQEPLDKIRAGAAAPESIAIRMLVPDTTQPMALPCLAEDLADDPAFRERSHAMTKRHSQAIVDAVHELDELGLITSGSVDLRVHQLAPLFKAFILNSEELFIGFYPVARRQVTLHAASHDVYDLMGKDVTLFHHATSDDDTTTGSQYVEQMTTWFDTIWTTVSRATSP
jgi:DNA-binding transcriptional regulator YhcF (GntR family)